MRRLEFAPLEDAPLEDALAPEELGVLADVATLELVAATRNGAEKRCGFVKSF